MCRAARAMAPPARIAAERMAPVARTAIGPSWAAPSRRTRPMASTVRVVKERTAGHTLWVSTCRAPANQSRTARITVLALEPGLPLPGLPPPFAGLSAFTPHTSSKLSRRIQYRRPLAGMRPMILLTRNAAQPASKGPFTAGPEVLLTHNNHSPTSKRPGGAAATKCTTHI